MIHKYYTTVENKTNENRFGITKVSKNKEKAHKLFTKGVGEV